MNDMKCTSQIFFFFFEYAQRTLTSVLLHTSVSSVKSSTAEFIDFNTLSCYYYYHHNIMLLHYEESQATR